MYTAKALFSNYPLMCAVVGWFAAQICKIFTGMFRERSFDIVTALFGTGGMPSSHTAAVSALTVACAVSYGFGSFFLLCCSEGWRGYVDLHRHRYHVRDFVRA